MSYDTSKINVTGTTSYLQDLDRRSRDIFRTMVKIFLETGEPVGSRSLSRQLPVSLSPASVRNIMFDLEQLGLIYAPHISAGRLPTDCGLRFFVDSLLEVGDLSEEERQEIDVQVRAKQSGMTSEQLLTEASQMLSGLSQGAGVVLTYKEDARLRHVEFVRIEPRRALVVLVFDKGSIENRVIDLPSGLPASALTEASNFLTNIIRNRTIGEARQELEQQLATKEAELHQLTRKIVQMGIAQWAGEGEEEIGSLIVRGRSNLLLDVDAQADLDRIRLLFDDLESKREMIRLLQLTETGEGVRIFIGSENKLFSLSGSSLILSSYRDGNDRIVGALGVIGPTRLNYARIIPMVDYTAKIISRMLE